MLWAKEEIYKWIWIRGLPPIDFWFSREKMIGDFIKKNEIQPRNMENYRMEALVEGEKALTIKRPPFPGGLKVPHLHFNANVYVLTPKQWGDFSGALMKDLGAKLAEAKEVSFDQVRAIAAMVDSV
jgi:hypothetical protein